MSVDYIRVNRLRWLVGALVCSGVLYSVPGPPGPPGVQCMCRVCVCLVRVVIELICERTTAMLCVCPNAHAQGRMNGLSTPTSCLYVPARGRGTKFHARIQFGHDRMARITDFVFYYKYDYTQECVVYESG